MRTYALGLAIALTVGCAAVGQQGNGRPATAVAGGSIPVIGGLVRNFGEREEAKRRAANRASGVLVTYAARDGNRYTARHTTVAITSAGDVALEGK